MKTRGLPEHLLPHRVVLVHPAQSTDDYGNTVYDYGEGATRTPVRAWMQQDQRSQLASSEGAEPLQARWLMATNHTDIHRRDRIEWPGHPESEPDHPVVFTLDGPSAPLTNPLSGEPVHHHEVNLKVVQG
ncbi:hypothetical protein [Nocardiopsis oceani]